jgi:hypothetical protein
VATWVFTNVTAAGVPAASADPALKPNQPNHSSPAPRNTSGMLCGRIGSFRQPMRLPSTRATPRAAAPAFRWTAVPPAKSSAFNWSPIQPPLPSSRNHTECATGKYTRLVQPITNTIQPRNVARSAIAPEISAGVMIANISWKATKASIGIWSPSGPITASGDNRPFRPIADESPITCPVSPPNVYE